MKKIIVEFSNERLITPSGLSLVGGALGKSDLVKRANRARVDSKRSQPQIKNGDILLTYIGLLCQGKPSFEAVRELHADPEYYKAALGISYAIPSAETLRQRMDIIGRTLRDEILAANITMFNTIGAKPSSLPCGFVPVDIDVTPCDNSKTSKEGVSRTYKGFDGYAPIMAYIGDEGFLVNTELREGKQHSQKGTPDFLRETLRLAHQMTEQDCCKDIRHPREGKTVYIGSSWKDVPYTTVNGEQKTICLRIGYEIIERTIDKHGQYLFPADIEVNTWWTNLGQSDDNVIRLYHEHGESEQYHSEIKTDMDVERFPSGKFDTNELVLELTVLAYNILRVIGQKSLKSSSAPKTKRKVKRRRIRTVISNLILIAGHVKEHARRLILSLGKSNIWIPVFMDLHHQLVLT